MEIFLKRYFWVVHVLVIAGCAILAGKATVHVIEAKVLLNGAGPDRSPAARRPPPRRPPPRPQGTASKDAQIVIKRNIFCSTCAPEPPPTPGGEVVGDGGPPPTSLPLALLATSVASDPQLSSATVVNTQTDNSGSYWVGEAIPGAGVVEKVAPLMVVFRNQSTNRLERIDLLGRGEASPPRPSPAISRRPTPPKDDFMAQLDAGIRKISDTQYEIDRSLVDKVLGDPTLIARSARIVPSIKDGKANGFKMYAIRPNSVYAKIGMQNGDTIHSVNGFDITSPDKALEVYTKVKSASNLRIELTRRGKPVSMEYSIR